MTSQVSFWKQAIVATLLVAAAAGAWQNRDRISAYLGLETEQVASKSGVSDGVPVIVAQVTTARDDIILEAVGTGRAHRSVMLRPETEGKIVSMPMVPGKSYAQDDILLKLDDTEQRLAVKLAETQLAEAERIRDRVSQLQGSGAAADARLDEVRTAAQIAALELDSAQAALEDRVLRAPFDGVAGLADAEIGAWIDSDTNVASFDDRGVILVEFDLPEALIAKVSSGMSVTARTPSAPGQVFEGNVTAVDSRISASTRTVHVRVALPNPEDELRPGASFLVRLELPGELYPVVPELSVLFSRGALSVWRVSDGAAERVEVSMVRRQDGTVLVEGPLTEGDLVVIEGIQRLAPGKPVLILGDANGGAA